MPKGKKNKMTTKIKNLEVLTFPEFRDKHFREIDCPDKMCMFEQYEKTLPEQISVSDWDKLEVPQWILSKYFEVFEHHC